MKRKRAEPNLGRPREFTYRWLLSSPLAISLLVGTIATSVFVSFDIIDLYFNVTREYEDYDLDEILLGLFIYLISFAITAAISGWKKAHHLSLYDQLTGLPNRTLLNDRLDLALARARRQGSQTGVLFVDLDFFKPINDQYGHAVGDAVLRIVAKRLTRSVRATDTVARLGGDEFVILLERVSDSETAARVAEKMLDALRKPMNVAQITCALSASIGISLYPNDAEDADGLMTKADDAMYDAKAAGRNEFRFGLMH